MISVSNLRSPKSGLPVANQYEIWHTAEGKNTIVFQSYDTKIAEVDQRNKTITISPLYKCSQTTNKYRNVFFKDIGFDELASLEQLERAIKKGSYSPLGVEELGVYKIIMEDEE